MLCRSLVLLCVFLGATSTGFAATLYCAPEPGSDHSVCSDEDPGPLGIKALRNASYTGLADIAGSIVLEDGSWSGEPPEPGAASVPRAMLLSAVPATGDIDDDGRDEAAVVIETNFGGTGVFRYVAVMADANGASHNIATVALGDRTQVISVGLEHGMLVVEAIRPGPGDAGCCPTQVVTLGYRWDGTKFALENERVSPQPFDLTVLRGRDWTLAEWADGEPVEPGVTITLKLDGERFAGFAGCNRYFAGVTNVERGAVAVAQPGATRMACEPAAMAAEQRYLDLLARVSQFWFHAGRLALAWTEGDHFGVMFFDAAY